MSTLFAFAKSPLSTASSHMCVKRIRMTEEIVFNNVDNRVIGTATVRAVSISAPVMMQIAHPTREPMFISIPEAPMDIIPNVANSICAPTAKPTGKLPSNKPQMVHVIRGLSKFNLPSIRESRIIRTEISVTINVCTNCIIIY